MKVLVYAEVNKGGLWHACNSDLGFLRFPYEKRLRFYSPSFPMTSWDMWFVMDYSQLNSELLLFTWDFKHLFRDVKDLKLFAAFNVSQDAVYSSLFN